MPATQQFFSSPEVTQLLTQAHSALEVLASGDKKKTRLQEVLQIILQNAQKFDEECPINIKWIGRSISDGLKKVASNAKGEVDTLYSLIYRCVVELDLSMRSDLSPELQMFQNYCREHRASFSIDAQQNFAFAEQAMPIAILKRLVNSDDIEKLRDTKTFATQVDQRVSAWEQSLQTREERVQEVAGELRKYEQAFNFVGFYHGFDELSRKKARELWALRIAILLLALVALVPLAVEGAFVYAHIDDIDAVKWGLVATGLPVLSLTVILLYFFRLAIRSADGVKSQLLQVELRKTLCRFIQSYADYVKRFKAEGGESLGKFESVIFSGIVANDEKIPATFDGLDQLSKLLTAVKRGPG
jgi:hypothetical protein